MEKAVVYMSSFVSTIAVGLLIMYAAFQYTWTNYLFVTAICGIYVMLDSVAWEIKVDRIEFLKSNSKFVLSIFAALSVVKILLPFC